MICSGSNLILNSFLFLLSEYTILLLLLVHINVFLSHLFVCLFVCFSLVITYYVRMCLFYNEAYFNLIETEFIITTPVFSRTFLFWPKINETTHEKSKPRMRQKQCKNAGVISMNSAFVLFIWLKKILISLITLMISWRQSGCVPVCDT